MNNVRNFLWKHLGMTLDQKTLVLGGVVLLSCLAAIGFGILSVSTNDSLFRFLFLLAIIPVGALLFGSAYRPLMWCFSDKSGRNEIEQEIALEQLKRRANDKPFER